MAEISELFEALKSLSPPAAAAGLLRSDHIRRGLDWLRAIIEAAIIDADDWAPAQIDAVISIAKPVVATLVSVPAENADEVVVAVVERALELGILLLEKSSFDGDDFSLQNNLAELIEVAATHVGAGRDMLHHDVPSSLEIFPVFLSHKRLESGERPLCDMQGNCSNAESSTDRVLSTLSVDLLQPDALVAELNGISLLQARDNLLLVAQHWAVIHLRCLPRLLTLIKVLFDSPGLTIESSDDTCPNPKLSFALRLLKFLANLVTEFPYGVCNNGLLHAVSICCDTFPKLFKTEIDVAQHVSLTCGNSISGMGVMIVEEFLHFLQIVLSESSVYRTVKTCIVASMVDILDFKTWRSNSSLRAPMVYSPRVSMYMLKLLKDIKFWTADGRSLKDDSVDGPDCSNEYKSGATSCFVHCMQVDLLKWYSFEEYLKIIFPPFKEWVGNLIHLISFLHMEGIKLGQKVERSHVSFTKPSNILESESTVNHEEEALFGNLFSEANRSVGASDVNDQPTIPAPTASSYNSAIEAASLWLSFLKENLFSPWLHNMLFADFCKKLNEDVVDELLSILTCDSCLLEESFEGNTVASHRTTKHISQICFAFLQDLIHHHIMSASLEEHLVDQILKTESGRYIYNEYSLMLMAYAFISRRELNWSHITRKIYKNFINFLLEKVKDVIRSCPVSSDLLDALPCSFHIEILLVAFHLSDNVGKAALAKYLFASLDEVDGLPEDANSRQLFSWGLIVSRMVLVLRHMLSYPSVCPSWLLLHLKSRLTGNPLRNQVSSWVSVVTESLLENLIQENVNVKKLLSQLIDFTPYPSTETRHEHALESLGFSCDDLCSVSSRILSFWEGKKPETVDELIVERYVFMLCWDTMLGCSSTTCLLRSQYKKGFNLSSYESLLQFSHFVTGGSDDVIHDEIDFYELICNLVQQFDILSLDDTARSPAWDFFRMGMWLSMLLSLFDEAIWASSSGLTTVEMARSSGRHPRDSKLMKLGVVLSKLLEMDQDGRLLDFFSCALKTYLQVLKKAYVSAIDIGKSYVHGFSPLLLNHTAFDKCREFLVQKSGIDSSKLNSVYNILPKLDSVTMRKDEPGHKIFTCMFHGFPSDMLASSGSLVSCVVVLQEALCTLDGYLKIKGVGGTLDIKTAGLLQLIDSIIAIRSDRTFQCLHDKCDAIYDILIAHHEEFSGLRDLILIKHIENFVAIMNSRGPGDSDIYEMVVSTFLEIINNVRTDDFRARTLEVCLGSDEHISADAKEFFCGKHDTLLVLADILDKCPNGAVSMKVLNLFVDLLTCGLYSGIKEKLQKKFLEMDLFCLSQWIERRLLGFPVESSGPVKTAKGSCGPLAEATMRFIACLTSQSSEPLSEELNCRMFQAMLMALDSAFTLYDVHSAKAYFNFVLQQVNDMALMKHVLERTVELMGKLADRESMLDGLKFLLGFLAYVLGDSKDPKIASDKHSSNVSTSNAFGAGSLITRAVASRKISENLVLSANQESSSLSIDCDATSIDEDDDDGTSDGELGCMDKDEEEDGNSEKALASKVCTFTSSGSNFMEQHWYFCYTCDLTVSKGCCSVCAKVCHRGHRVVYSRSSRFFCDCGAGGVRGSSCQCLKPRKYVSSNSAQVNSRCNFQLLLPFSQDADQSPDSDSELDNDIFTDSPFKLSIPGEAQGWLPAVVKELNLEAVTIELCNKLLPVVVSRRDSDLLKDKKVRVGDDRVLMCNTDLFQLNKTFKSGSFDLRIKTEYPNSKEFKSHLSSGSLIKSLLSINVRGRLAVAEGDKVSIFDVGQLIGQPTITPVTVDKTNVKPLSRNMVRFEIVSLLFNPVIENYLAVAGYEECQVLTVNSRGEVTDRLAVELALQGAYVRRIEWVPGSQVQLMVVTNMFVKIYDLSQDNISPMHYFNLSDDRIVDATLVPASLGKLLLLVLSEEGQLFRLELSVEGNVGAKSLKDIVKIQGMKCERRGLSLLFSSTYRLLFLSYQDGTTLMARLDVNATSITEVSSLYEVDQEGEHKPAGLHHCKELLAGSGMLVSLSSPRSNASLALTIGPGEVFAQNMRHGGGSTLPSVGISAYKPLSKDKIHCFVLHDDGSLQIYSHTPVLDGNAAYTNVDQKKKLGSGILNSGAYAGLKPEFPLDFFEKTICITADVKITSDGLKNVDSDGIKQRFSSDDGYLESPNPAGFKVTVLNSNPDMVMVGIRIHVGNSSASHIPSDVTIFQRVIKLDEGMRSWYDIPFTAAESLLADEEFTVLVGRTFDGSTLPRIDCLEVYGRLKEDFGWKEKLDQMLDIEAHVLGCSSDVTGIGKKCRSAQAAPMQDQVLADALNLLSMIYSLSRPDSSDHEDINFDMSKLKCRNVLEVIFQNDRTSLLPSAACRVIQAVFPRKEIYYQVKDTMRLLGVVTSISLLLSRIGVGGAVSGWLMREYIAQTRMVSKIAMHRRSSLISFLESHGSEVVDGLMQVLWGILDLERPDTQTINKIVVPSVELIYSYAECLALSGFAVAPAVSFLKRLLFAPYEAVQTSSSLAISSRLLQVPFPKQTMLASDDAVESHAASNVATDRSAARRNTQVMIEEDSTTSSVQYCCDGCSTVPILRRRWHCNICPDFDLCEACYEVLGSDRLPPPHSRDHPMSAIPIEMDSLGGDANEIQLSMDELNDSGLMLPAADISTQNSPSSVNAVETNEAGVFAVSADAHRIVSISASKRAVNALLLRNLIEDLNGWMVSTSGIRAIPLVQLFYRLSSAVGGPFMDSTDSDNLDLEKFVRWLFDQLNISRPFPVKTRTSFGEVGILVFMFFTLMLRNWHQPGNDSSQTKAVTNDKDFLAVTSSANTQNDDKDKNEFASQLIRACSVLRQQAFVDYLMDILQQLVHIFKPFSSNAESSLSCGSGCGSLLAVRRELPAGNFTPFFTDSYAKAHRVDLFMDYNKLLLENTFRLVYSLVRPEKQGKSTDKDKLYKSSAGKDLKLDGFQDVLCSYISNPNTTFVRRYARRLFLYLCGSKSHYYSVRDTWQISNEVKKLHKLLKKSEGFLNQMPYERSVKLVKCLTSLAEVAAARPKNWQKYCSRNVDLLSFLLDGIFHFGEESVIQTLKLLNLAFYTGRDIGHITQKPESGETGASTNRGGAQSLDSKKKRKCEEASESCLDKSCVDIEPAIGIFGEKDGCLLRNFIDSFLLEWSSTSVRLEARSVLYGIWQHGKPQFKEVLLNSLLQKVKLLPMYGQNIVEYVELMTWLFGKVPNSNQIQLETELMSRCLTADAVRSIFDTLHSQNELLANHPNSRIYNTLSSLVEFDGYYLESEPCVSCSCPEVPYSRMKLESLKSETKFTDNRIIVKCTGSYTIQTVMMNVHDARKSKSVKMLNLYYNNRPVTDLSELKNNWSLWKRAKSCHLAQNQTELKVEFIIPITACNFMIELDSFYENLQASSLESLQCPRCSRSVTDKHGICSNCHENAYQCRQCRNINYENLDSFLCNECGYSKYGRFEFNFMAKPSFTFDNMENDDDMKKGLAAIESESENAHRRYQQLLGFKKPLLKLVSSIGEQEIDSQQKDTVQQMMVSMPGPSCKVNRKIALLGVLYGEKCKAAFDSVTKSVQTLQGLRRMLMTYLHQKNSDDAVVSSRVSITRSSNNCYGCAIIFVSLCMELLQLLSKYPDCKKQLVAAGILSEIFENNMHQGPKTARVQARAVLCAFSEGDAHAVAELNALIQNKVMYCLEHHRSMDIAIATREELLLLSETCSMVDDFWETRLRVSFHLLFSSIKLGAKHPAISEHIILPCLRIISQACTPPKSDADKDAGKSSSSLQARNETSITNNASGGSKFASEFVEKNVVDTQKGRDISLLSYYEWERGASYLDFVRRQYKISHAVKTSTHRARLESQKLDYLALKYALKWKRRACRRATKTDFSALVLGSWVSELILSTCSHSIRSEVCMLISMLCPQNSSRRFQLLSLLMSLLPATIAVGESAAEYFELFFKMIEPEAARLFLTVRGCPTTICKLITQEVSNIESQEKSLNIDISQGFILHKLIELLKKLLEVPNIRIRFMQEELLSQLLEALLVIRGLIIQKTKLINDCNRLLKDLLDSLLLESTENKRQFIRACISGLQNHAKEKKGRTALFILEQLCNLICPSKPEPVYLLILNKAHTQEEFIRGSMTKNPYTSAEIGPLMRDVKNKICHQLDLLGLLEDDYGMELLVAGNIISLDLSISQVYEQVWKKYHIQSHNGLSGSAGLASSRDSPPMTVTYRLQGLDGEATEPMIKELEEEREETQDPEVEYAIAGAVREFGGLEVILSMIQNLRDYELKSNKEEIGSVLNLLMYCCKIRENRQALLRLGALVLLLETARRAFSVDAMEPAEGILLIVESLTVEANESDISLTQSVLTVSSEENGTDEQAKKIVLMFLERLFHTSGSTKSNKQQRNNEMVARILPYLTYGEPEAMEALIQQFDPYLQDWGEFDNLQQKYHDNPKDEILAQHAAQQRAAIENFVRVSESLKTSSCGERLKDIILDKGIIGVAVRHLKDSFSGIYHAGFKTSTEWASCLKLPSVPMILSMLRGLAKGHLPTQRYIDDGGILPVLHALEGVAGENEIGARAENLLDTLADEDNSGDGFLGEKIRKLRQATRDEMRRRALRRREELLQGLGMRQEFASDGGERIVIAQPSIEGLEDVEEEEDGLACMVCREGYSLRPNDMLGVYSYSKRVSLGATSTGNNTRADCVYTTVSHFNIIHFQCHQEAKRADAALKNPKKEWEGATLRNNETLCNSLFPIRGPSVPLTQYVRCVDQYWENLNALGRADGNRLRLLTYDIVLMLARFATGALFNIDCKGGGRESNSCFLPFMIQMASYLLDQGGPNQQRSALSKAVSVYLSSVMSDSPTRSSSALPTVRSSAGFSDETVQFMMVHSLLSESYEDWVKHRPAFLQRGIYHAYMQHKHGRSTLQLSSDSNITIARSAEGSSADCGSSCKLFAIVKPMLVYTGLIEQLQQFFKRSRAFSASTGPSIESVGEGAALEGWEVVMRERLLNMKEMMSFSKEMLSWLEDMITATDLQEAFDVMGMLGDVFSGGFVRCEDFIEAAINSCKS